MARNIAYHHVFSANVDGSSLNPTAFRAPLYSALIAAVSFKDSAPIFVVLLIQVVLGAATVTLCYLIAIDQFGRTNAFLAAARNRTCPNDRLFHGNDSQRNAIHISADDWCVRLEP